MTRVVLDEAKRRLLGTGDGPIRPIDLAILMLEFPRWSFDVQAADAIAFRVEYSEGLAGVSVISPDLLRQAIQFLAFAASLGPIHGGPR